MRIEEIKWQALYSNWSIYSSDKYQWLDIPKFNLIKVHIFYNNGKMGFSGWDAYWIRQIDDKVGIGGWKDDDPTDPYYGMGFERIFSCNEQSKAISVSDIEYYPMGKWKDINSNIIKRGVWVTDEIAKKMGIL